MVLVMPRSSSSVPNPRVPAMPHMSACPLRGGWAEPPVEVVDHPPGNIDLLREQSLSRLRAPYPWGAVREARRDGTERTPQVVLGEVPHQPVAALLVVGIAAPSRGDVDGRD